MQRIWWVAALSAAAMLAGDAEAGLAETLVLRGIVLDQARAAVPGARLAVTLEGRSLGQEAVAGADGRFSLSLLPGRYRVEASAEGFQTSLVAADLRTGDQPPLEIVLTVGPARAVITVAESLSGPPSVASSLKAPVLLLDTPQTVTMITGAQIREQSMRSMADVVRYVPGITMAQGEGHRDAPVIRGNATTADFFVNGVRDDVQYFRDLYNLERVEAVKGANALTFGRGGGGGVINRVTKQAEPGPGLREVTLEGGSFLNRRASADLGQAFAKDRVAVRLNTMYENSNAFRHDVNFERYGVAPTATFRLGQRTLLRTGYELFHDGRVVDRGIPSFQGRPSPAHRSTFFGDPANSHSRADVHLGSATLEHQVGTWLLRNVTLVGDYDKFYRNVFPGATNAALTQVSISGYDNQTYRRNVFNQTDVSGTVYTGRIRHTLLAGTEFGRQNTSNFRSTAYFGNATSINVPFWTPNQALPAVFRQAASDADNGAINTVAAGFVQDQIELTRYLQVVAGVRFDAFRMDFRDHRAANGGRLRREDNLLAPRLGVVVKPAANVSLYGSYSVTFLPSAGDQFASLNATTQTLRPERFNNYEVGAKVELRRRLFVTASLYRLDRNNSTARDPLDPARVVQTGSQRTNGLEAGLTGSLTKRWQVTGGYAAMDAFVSRPTIAAPLGAKVALVPRHSFSLWNSYRPAARWSLGLGTIRQASLFTGIDNTVRLPGFTRLDAAATYSFTERLRLQANVENLLDATYYPTAHSNNNILPGTARSVRLSLTARF